MVAFVSLDEIWLSEGEVDSLDLLEIKVLEVKATFAWLFSLSLRLLWILELYC